MNVLVRETLAREEENDVATIANNRLRSGERILQRNRADEGPKLGSRIGSRDVELLVLHRGDHLCRHAFAYMSGLSADDARYSRHDAPRLRIGE